MKDIVRRIHPLFLVLGGLLLLASPYLFVFLPESKDERQSDVRPEEQPHATFTADLPGEATGAISGRVVDAKGEPFHGAKVSLSVPGKMHSALSDERGEFLLTSLPTGSYALDVTAVIGEGETVTVDVGAPVRAGSTTRLFRVIDLGKGRISRSMGLVRDGKKTLATISGRVTDEDDVPLPGVSVVAWEGVSSSPPSGARRGETDEEGAFRLEMPWGDIHVWAASTTHLPGGLERSVYESWEPVIRLRRAVTLSGMVVDEHDRPIPDALVRATQTSHEEKILRYLGVRPVRATGPDGRFSCGALFPDRPVGLEISTTERGRRRIRALRPDRRDVVVRMGPVGTIEGRILLDGKPVSVRVSARGPGPDDVAFADSGAAAGRFRLGPVPAGVWTLFTEIDEGAAWATRDVIVRPNRTVDGVEMNLDPGPDLEVVGRLLPSRDPDGNETDIDIWIRGPVRRWGTTDEHGRFAVRGLVPGVYVADGEDGTPSAAFTVPREGELVLGGRIISPTGVDVDVVDARGVEVPEIDVLHLRPGVMFRRDAAEIGLYEWYRPGRHGFVLPDPRRADPWSGPPAVIDLAGGESRRITLTDEVPRVSLRGRLRSPEPIHFDMAMLVRPSGLAAVPRILGGWGAVDTGGWFEVADVSPGRYLVKLMDPIGFDHVTVGRIRIDETGSITRELDLPGTMVSGTVVEPGAGRPVPWARVSLYRVRADPEWAAPFRIESAGTTADASGAFLIRHLPKGRYEISLSAAHRATAFVGEVVIDGSDRPPLVLEARSGAVARINLVREDGAPTERGTFCVRDDAGRLIRFDQPYAWCCPSLEAWSPTRIRLLPGRYTVHARAPGHAPTAQTLQVTSAGGHASVVLWAGAAARLEVVDAKGPVANARIRVLYPDGISIRGVPGLGFLMEDEVGYRTSMAGRVLVDELPPGKLRFVATTGDGRRGEVVRQVEEASLFDVTITLK
jgi:carboxypeptidase family protein